MRTGMWGEARARAFGVAAVAAMLVLGGCGGGSDTPALEVAVKVDGVADASNPLTAGESTTISVPSGTTLSFDSDGETRWSPAATDSSYEVNSFSYTAKSMTVSSNGGGTLVVVFTDKADETQKATLTVTVEPKQFARVAPKVNEFREFNTEVVQISGDISTQTDRYVISAVESDGSYARDYIIYQVSFDPVSRSYFDAADRVTRRDVLATGTRCTYSSPLGRYVYPMQVGKSWSNDVTITCSDGTSAHITDSSIAEAFELVTVPAGTAYAAIRVTRQATTVNFNAAGAATRNQTIDETCWWAVDLGREVKCEGRFSYAGPTEGYFAERIRTDLTSYSH